MHLIAGTPDTAKGALGTVAQEVAAVVEKFTGKSISGEQATDIAAKFISGSYGEAAGKTGKGDTAVSVAPVAAVPSAVVSAKGNNGSA